MSKHKEKKDPADNQMEFDWDFPSKLEKVLHERMELQDRMADIRMPDGHGEKTENEFDLCVLLAAGVKRAITESGLSREQVVDGINGYFSRSHEGASRNDGTCRNPLTIHMFNKYLSKPSECPIPAYYLFAIHHITRSLEPARVLVEVEDARIATGSELRQLALGKLEEHIVEINRLKKEIKCQR